MFYIRECKCQYGGDGGMGDTGRGVAGEVGVRVQSRSRAARGTNVRTTHLTDEPLSESYRICILLTIFN